MKALGYLTTILAICLLGPIWSGYVLSILWTWFLVPTFHIHTITIPCAIGLNLIVSMLVVKSQDIETSKEKKASSALAQGLAMSIVYPLVILAMGAIVHTFF